MLKKIDENPDDENNYHDDSNDKVKIDIHYINVEKFTSRKLKVVELIKESF